MDQFPHSRQRTGSDTILAGTTTHRPAPPESADKTTKTTDFLRHRHYKYDRCCDFVDSGNQSLMMVMTVRPFTDSAGFHDVLLVWRMLRSEPAQRKVARDGCDHAARCQRELLDRALPPSSFASGSLVAAPIKRPCACDIRPGYRTLQNNHRRAAGNVDQFSPRKVFQRHAIRLSERCLAHPSA